MAHERRTNLSIPDAESEVSLGELPIFLEERAILVKRNFEILPVETTSLIELVMMDIIDVAEFIELLANSQI
jgi:hypothetical protein